MITFRQSAFWITLLSIFTVPSAFAATCTVGYSAGNTHATIQAAIDDTTCATINIGEKNFYENLVINREVTIEGARASLSDIDGSSVGPVITFQDPSPYDRPTVTLKNLTLQNGKSSDNGGGIKNESDMSLILDNVTLKNNIATKDGGGIYHYGYGSITIQNGSVLKKNTAGGSGGGVYGVLYSIDVEQSSIIQNTAADVGGGMVLAAEGINLWIFNSTIGENSALKSGGIWTAGSILAGNITVYKNSSTTSGYAGGIDTSTSNTHDMQIWNSAIAKNTGGDCDVQEVTSFGGNLDSDSTCAFTAATDLPGTDPGFSSLMLSVYQAASKTSAVIDNGNGSNGTGSLCGGADEKGNARSIDGNGDGTALCDIGAMESKLKLNLVEQLPISKAFPKSQ